MRTQLMAMRVLPAAVLAAGLVGAGASVMAAQTTPQRVDIQASKLTTVVPRHSRTGMQDEVVQLSQRVSYADLDLATTRGARELTNRIDQAATLVCQRLGALFPEGSFATQWQNERICVGEATRDAMRQARAAITGAQQRRAER